MNHKAQVPAKLLFNPLHLLSLGFGSGLSPKMPGTMGTLVGLLLFWVLPSMSWKIYLIIVVVGIVLGIYLCAYTARALQVHDHPAIVWDEIMGILITLFLVPREWPWLLTAFILFRFFDILKPWPISVVDKRLKGGLGIMLDDVIAGVFSLFIIQITLYLLKS